ncbi:MAG: DUF4981 domain-containing protein, partial [Muribaculaceae bacterium]|nr:DUF4981 domain-containing protein [Muribaculaceae bacterium]
VEIYAYGGDFNDYDASDGNFCVNGLVNPDRIPNPHADEVSYYYQNIWTTPSDLSNGKMKVYNENFFRDLSDVTLNWVLLNNGVPVRDGSIDHINVAPGATTDITVPYGKISDQGEWALNLYYNLKHADGLLPAGHTIARQQFILNDVKGDVAITNPVENNLGEIKPEIINNQRNYLIVKGNDFTIEFNRWSGYMSKYEVNDTQMIAEEGQLTPNFWRAPTDNDYGAGLQHKYAAWKNPEIKLESLNADMENGLAVVKAKYSMPGVKAHLALTYTINGAGAVQVNQTLTADKTAEVSGMFRFGMQMQMPETFSSIEYYGRGPIENYADRNHSTLVGLYNQKVADQFYAYVRPQETGTKSDVRYWKQLNNSGNGLEFISENPFSASALNYSIESLDGGPNKANTHSPEVQKVDYTNLLIDKAQIGLGCVNSWGAMPLKEYLLPYGDYSFTFVMKPVFHQLHN